MDSFWIFLKTRCDLPLIQLHEPRFGVLNTIRVILWNDQEGGIWESRIGKRSKVDEKERDESLCMNISSEERSAGINVF